MRGASGASSYSGMSGVSQNHGPQRMPRFGDPEGGGRKKREREGGREINSQIKPD